MTGQTKFTLKMLLLGSALSAAPYAYAQTAPTAGQPPAAQDTTTIDDVIVTAQRRAESIQTIPIAVSALSEETLQSTGVVGVTDLRTQVPNLAFSRTTVNGFNFAIRGIGSKLTAVSGDTGVGVHVNNSPLASSRIADAEFYDMERVEVLRGPQGTLYGRNATGGVFNALTAKPTDVREGSISGEAGNFDTLRFKGMFNLPLGEAFAVRAAGYYLDRGGFTDNVTTGNDVDDRSLWSTRLTAAFKPNDRFDSYLLWEHFEEADHRLRGSKLLCTPDPGRTTVGAVTVNNPIAQGLMSQGCLPRSLYSDAAFGAPNTLGTTEGPIGLGTGMLPFNANAGVVQRRSLREIQSPIDPRYEAQNDFVQFLANFDLTDSLQVSLLSAWQTDDFDARQRLETFLPSGRFLPTAFSPGGVFNDPQLGAQTSPLGYSRIRRGSEQFSTELRIQSSFDGPWNYNLGAIYVKYDTSGDLIFVNTGFNARAAQLVGTGLYIDPLVDIDFTGHNYLDAREGYSLRSKAVFGELYWEPTDTLKLTAGLRYTDDQKSGVSYAPALLQPGRGLVANPDEHVDFQEFTGRFNAAWSPDLAFTDRALLYASYSRGYKAGGLNPTSGGLGTVAPTFAPEFVNAFEAGAKTTLPGGDVQLNATAFYYDYAGYQVAKVVGISVANENLDAEIKGLEIETIYQPFGGLRLNMNLGLLETRIKGGLSIDELNITQGEASLVSIKNSNGLNCAVNTSAFAGVIAGVNAGAIPIGALLGACTGAFASRGVVVSDGIAANLKDKELPDSPKYTVSFGAEYRFELGRSWVLTPRADYYRQGETFARIYNSEVDRLKGYQNLNLSLTLENEDKNLQIQAYARNATDETTILSSIPTNSLFGLSTQVYLSDPRTYGLVLTKRF